MTGGTAGTTTATTAELVARYASGFNATYATAHTVTSPLGVWLLLAVAAPATAGDARTRVETVLGCRVDDAAERAAKLLELMHPAVVSAAALWARTRFLNETFAGLAERLPAAVEHGDLPTQPEADAWIAAKTGGELETLPITVSDATSVVLATALATESLWHVPFKTTAAAELGGPFAESITTALLAPHEHQQFLAVTATAGIVAVHAAGTLTGLIVISVLAGTDVPPGDVHDAAHQIAALLAGNASTATKLSLFHVAVGKGPAFTVTETIREGYGAPRFETVTTMMAAWSADAVHEILAAAGFAELCEAFESFLLPEFLPGSYEAKQVITSSYTRTGFKAAAATAFGQAASAMRGEKTTVSHRHADVRFNRSHAVVAMATNTIYSDTGVARAADVPAWHGIPVYSAWVTKPDDVSPVDRQPHPDWRGVILQP